MNTNEINQLSIADMDFFQPTEEQISFIHGESACRLMKKFYKRMLISFLVSFIVILMETIGRINMSTEGNTYYKSIPKMIIIVLIVLAIYNIISFIYTRVKINMNDIVNRYQCVSGIITEKYDSRQLSKKTREFVPNYILFSNEQGHCTTALPTKKHDIFCQAAVGDEILVIKESPMGMAKYDFLLKK